MILTSNEEYAVKGTLDWKDLIECDFASENEDDGEPRIWCEHDGKWCDILGSRDFCCICTDHQND